MAENKVNDIPAEEADIVELFDEEGNGHKFELIAEHQEGDALYFAAIPCEESAPEQEFDEYLILKQYEEDGEFYLAEIEDDAEFERIAEIFDNLFDEEIDYDAPKQK